MLWPCSDKKQYICIFECRWNCMNCLVPSIDVFNKLHNSNPAALGCSWYLWSDNGFCSVLIVRSLL